MTKAATMCEIPWRLEDGGCAALPLPADDSIARVARSHVTALLPALGLSVQDVHDIKLMVSELATNVLQHAMPHEGASAAELWVYQRGDGQGRDELVVKAFDTHRDWPASGTAPHRSDHGRGLKIVELLTQGRWGHHPSRSRLRTPAARGKATWFALPLPRTVRRRDVWRVEGPYATKDLRTLLVQRGLGHFQPAEGADRAALSDGRGLTVWCEEARFRWRTGAGETGCLPVTDITEACERIVELCEASPAAGSGLT